jgi:GDPmannose 4,6-dehydratase
VEPDETYHLAAQSFVSYSFDDEFSTLQTNINGTHHVLAAMKDIVPKCRFYFAGSSEMFGKVAEIPQKETTRFHPRSAYGISKVAGFDLTRNYREAYGFHASNGILFNHESPRRGFEFVTRKITSGVARILAGKSETVSLGNLEAKRDWGHAKDYVEAMWLMLQQDVPDDYVVATGTTHSVRDFVEMAFRGRRPGLSQACRHRSPTLPACGSRFTRGGSRQGSRALGMDFQNEPRITGSGDG